MKNLVPFNGDCFTVHKRAVNKKHKGDLKDRLLKLNPSVEAEYKVFAERFKTKELNLVNPNAVLSLSKDDLLTLYNYQSSIIISVRESIRNLQIKTIITTCQNCTIDSANTFDHILPKANYPEFIVNPKNLFPCCSTCNSYKLDINSSGNQYKFLNLYLDDLPNVQYLFVDVYLDPNKELDFKFYLKNEGNKISNELFNIIESHYKYLHLFERMKLKSIEYVSELESKLITFAKLLSMEEIAGSLIQASDIDKQVYGYNHWKCILEQTLLNSKIFIDNLNLFAEL